MAMYNSAHPGELIRETIDGLSQETGKKLSVEDWLKDWVLPAKHCLPLQTANKLLLRKWPLSLQQASCNRDTLNQLANL
jgi:hypothetical protein